jgi:hypothetical protein
VYDIEISTVRWPTRRSVMDCYATKIYSTPARNAEITEVYYLH